MCCVFSNQNRESWRQHCIPLPGMALGSMTSNAEMRSDATITTRSSPRSNVSRTFPRRMSGIPGNSTLQPRAIPELIWPMPSRRRLQQAEPLENRVDMDQLLIRIEQLSDLLLADPIGDFRIRCARPRRNFGSVHPSYPARAFAPACMRPADQPRHPPVPATPAVKKQDHR